MICAGNPGEIGNRFLAGFQMAAVVDPTLRSSPVDGARALGDLPISHVDFAEFSSDLLSNFRRLHEVHGPIAAVEEAGQRVVFLFSPEYNQQVLSDTERFHAHFFTIRGPRRSAVRSRARTS